MSRTDTLAEQTRLEHLAKQHYDYLDALEDVFCFYIGQEEPEKAELFLRRYTDTDPDAAQRPFILFKTGQMMEQKYEYAEAEKAYRLACAKPIDDPALLYFVRNNLGRSLNMLGRFAEAEPYLKEATRLDPLKSNAFRNLGLCYQGMGRLEDAARQFIRATKANAADIRSLELLGEMAKAHPDLFITNPSLTQECSACRALVTLAKEFRKNPEGKDLTWDALHKETESAYEEGEYDRAADLARKALDAAGKETGPNSFEAAVSLGLLGVSCYFQGQYAEAGRCLTRALAIGETIYGPDHPVLITHL